MNRNICLFFVAAFVAVAFFLSEPPLAEAGGKITVDETKWISIGAGLRTSFTTTENAAPNGTDRSKAIAVESMRLYVNGQIHKFIKFEFNTEALTTSAASATPTVLDVTTLDAILKLEFNDYLNLWGGFLLPPSDRSNLSGPYYLNSWAFPAVQAYPAIRAGRDAGLSFWGQINGGQFKYQIGAFEGRMGGSNTSDNLMLASRFTLNLWDPEPGYYNSSTYYGNKRVLALGFALMHQPDGAGTAALPSDFTAWNVDALMETPLANGGVITLEGAYYDYDLNGSAAIDPSLTEGDSFFILASYLFPTEIGIGKFQPQFRYQSFDPTIGGNVKRYDAGLNYIIEGHNARVALLYAITDPGPGLSDIDTFTLGMQIQF